MHYKTIVLGVIESHPALHRQLIENQILHQTLQRLTATLSQCHAEWIEALATKPTSNPAQLSNQAMELAIQELTDSLQPASEASDHEGFPMEAAMEFIRRHTPDGS